MVGFISVGFHLRLLTVLPFGQPGFGSNGKSTPVLSWRLWANVVGLEFLHFGFTAGAAVDNGPLWGEGTAKSG